MALSNLSPGAESQSFDFQLFPTAQTPDNTKVCRAIFCANQWALILLATQFPALFPAVEVGTTFSSIGLSDLNFQGTSITAPYPLNGQALAMQYYTSRFNFPENHIRSKFIRQATGLSFGSQRIQQYRIVGSQVNLVNTFDVSTFIAPDTYQANIVDIAGLWQFDASSIWVYESPAQAGLVIANFHAITAKFELQNQAYVAAGQLYANGQVTGIESSTFALGAARS